MKHQYQNVRSITNFARFLCFLAVVSTFGNLCHLQNTDFYIQTTATQIFCSGCYILNVLSAAFICLNVPLLFYWKVVPTAYQGSASRLAPFLFLTNFLKFLSVVPQHLFPVVTHLQLLYYMLIQLFSKVKSLERAPK